MKIIKELKKGDFFTLKDCSQMESAPANLVWIRGDYDKSSKSYFCFKFADVSHEHFYKGSKQVFVDFVF